MARLAERKIKVELTLTEPEGDYSTRTIVSSELSITLPVPNPEALGPLVTGAVQALIDVATDKGFLAADPADAESDAESDPGFPPQDS